MNRMFNSKLRLKFVIGICLVSIIPVLIVSIFSYSNASANLLQEVGRAKQETLKQVQQRIDDKLTALNRTITQNVFTPSLNEFLTLAWPTHDYKIYGEMRSLLNSIEALVDNVESATLYLTEFDLLLTSENGLQPADQMNPVLYERIQSNVNHTPYFWLDDLNADNTARAKSKNITYVREVPVDTEVPLGYIIIRLKDRLFFEVYNEMDDELQSEMLIATPSGTIFSDWDRSLLGDNLTGYSFIQDIVDGRDSEDAYYEEIDGQQMLVNYWRSPYNNWIYISIIPTNEITPTLANIKHFTIMLCASLILICLIAALFLSRHFYKGISTIMDRIRRRSSSQHLLNTEKKDEIGLINAYMDSLQELNSTLHEKVELSKPELAKAFVQHMLLEPVKKKDIERQFEYYDLPREEPYYTALCIELDEKDIANEDDLQLFVYATTNVAEELLQEFTRSIVSKVGKNQIAVIINHQEKNPQMRMNAAFQYAELICNTLEHILKVTTTIGIGRCYERPDIRRSFIEARQALEYRLVMGTGHVIYVEQVEPTASSSYHYPYEIEQQLLIQIKIGNLEEADALLHHFAMSLLETPNLYVEQVRMNYTMLLSRTVREFYDITADTGVLLFDYNLFEKMNELQTMDKIQEWLSHEVFPTIANHLQSVRTEHNHKTIEHIIHYMIQHYDQDLSQPLLAEIAGMPPSHFSQMFKEEAGVTFSDYLIMIRMEKAKHLLLETDMKVADIAEQLRYNNSQNFIRTFKKTYGIPPGEYRSQNRSE